jgi:hypothetical protein
MFDDFSKLAKILVDKQRPAEQWKKSKGFDDEIN